MSSSVQPAPDAPDAPEAAGGPGGSGASEASEAPGRPGGYGGAAAAPRSIPGTVLEACRRYADAPAVSMTDGGAWGRLTYARLAQCVRASAAALIREGVRSGDRVVIAAPNRPEWVVMDLAIMSIGAITVPILPQALRADVRHILRDSGAVLAFAAGHQAWSGLRTAREDAPDLRVVYDLSAAEQPGPGAPWGTASLGALLAQLPRSGPERTALDVEAESRLAELTPQHTCAILYTPGTTGSPKGAETLHDNVLHQGRAISTIFPMRPREVNLSYLPLAHSYERGWVLALILPTGMHTVLVTDPREVSHALPRVRPQTLASVPRLYELIYEHARAAFVGPHRTMLLDRALTLGLQVAQLRDQGDRIPTLLAARHALAERMVLGPLREAIGGPKTVMSCGGGTLPLAVEEFFTALGTPVHVGYGLTEAGPVVTCNAPGATRTGTVGRELPGCQVRIAADGEILVRGENVMKGYWNLPQETAAVLRDGWLHTGDVGMRDGEGYLRVTDRLSDLLVTAAGVKVAPGPIEAAITADPYVSAALVIGEGRPYLTALIAPNFELLLSEAEQRGWSTDRHEIIRRPEVVSRFAMAVRKAGADAPGHLRVQRFRLIPAELSMTTGQLTPTMRVRRRELQTQYADLVAAMYPSTDPGTTPR